MRDAHVSKGRRFRAHVLLQLILDAIAVGVRDPVIHAAELVEESPCTIPRYASGYSVAFLRARLAAPLPDPSQADGFDDGRRIVRAAQNRLACAIGS
jgi:hypothetical protein